MRDDALEADETRRRKRRGEGKAPVPTPYALLEMVTIMLEPARDPAPEELYQSKFTDEDKAIKYNDDGFMSLIEGESKQQIEQRKAHNCRIQKGRDTLNARRKATENDQQAYNESQPGHVPDRLGVVTIRQHPERNNLFPGLLSWWFSYSTLTNTVYACHTAVAAARHELDTAKPYQMPNHRRLYTVARRGFPMNPCEVRKLAQLVMDRHHSDTDCIEGFQLHAELHHLTCLTAPE
jgi:hypothetical protein